MVVVGLEDPAGNRVGLEGLEAGREGAHVCSFWDLEGAAAVGQEADLLFLRVGQVRNLLQLVVVREHHKLGAQGEVAVQARSVQERELVVDHS